MVLKYVGVSMLGSLLPRLLDKISDIASDLYDKVTEPDVDEPKRQARKKVDTRRITTDQALYVKEYRDNNEGTWNEHTVHLNELFGLDKSNSYYFRVWKKPLNELKLKFEEDV